MDLSWLPIVLGLLATGVIAGLLAGLLGVGGGIVIVPVLFLVFEILGVSTSTAMSVATGTSLVTIVATSISSVRAHAKKGNVDVSILKIWGPPDGCGRVSGSVDVESIRRCLCYRRIWNHCRACCNEHVVSGEG